MNIKEKIKSWIWDHIGGKVYAISEYNDVYPVTPFIPARKMRKFMEEARNLYPNEELYIGLHKVLKSHGLIIR